MEKRESNPVVLSVDGLTTEFRSKKGWVRVLDDVSFDVRAGEILGIVGESGSGKSVTCLSLMRLLKSGQSRILSRSIRLGDEEISGYSERRMRQLRGTKMSMILQDPMSSLNPTLSIGLQVKEAVERAPGVRRNTIGQRVVAALEDVHLPSPADRVKQYPHALSGGMRQRVCTAMAIAARPKVLFADEPTTALDVTIQSQILALLTRLRDEHGTAIVFVTHDLGVVAQTCDRVAVMYAGKIVESGPVGSVLRAPVHPYTKGLLASVPRIGEGTRRIEAMKGQPPDPRYLPLGCRFEPRCSLASSDCAASYPPFRSVADNHAAACWNLDLVANVAN